MEPNPQSQAPISARYSIEQTDPPRSPRETLPTMYDLPSEDPEEPGLPGDHDFQPQLLRETFRPPKYPSDQVFGASDLNLYYDARHLGWYKQPGWVSVVGVPRLCEQRDLRLSYVIWQEGTSLFVVVELLSPGTEKEDLGQSSREVSQPPSKWEVYEQLRIPYCILFDRYTDQLRAFTLTAGYYQQLDLTEPRVWMPTLELGLGLWSGDYQGIERQWLCRYDAQGNWIPTDAGREQQRAEQAESLLAQERQRTEQERQRAEQERQRAEQLEERLQALGLAP